ncbi:V-set and immunoglobulin domain-containing protein 4-like isoform X8 [Hemitrygon akajei]|uniref:V-set and immunoglobulin domain-containing protein 4-like isoform X8 n=1 Tax=Hemitrygon akajei TaxID=2704970 RepID=UPI003BF976F1
MEKRVCFLLALLLFWDLTNSLTLIVPEEVKGLLRRSVTIPCFYEPSPQYTDVVVTWYINTYDILIRRVENYDYIPLSINRDRITMNHSPGDVSLKLNKLAYNDRGTYTCEVKCRLVTTSKRIQKRSSANLIVVRGNPSTTSPVTLSSLAPSPSALPSTRSPTSLTSNPISALSSKRPSVILTSDAIIDLSYEFTRYRNAHCVQPVNLVSGENNEYETMKEVKQNEYSSIHMGSACASG